MNDYMREFINEIKIGNPISNLYRKNHVLIMLETEGGKFILGAKKGESSGFYPQGFCRMIGGAIKKMDETLAQSAIRELSDELSLEIEENQITPLMQVETVAHTTEGTFSIITTVFYHKISSKSHMIELEKENEISDIVIFSENEFKDLAIRMLFWEGIYRGEGFSFDWKDYGQIYGFIHKKALDVLRGKVPTSKQH
jgi:ADP-ribose pyrophosphatase YjhB (NUDIX family)